MKKYPHHRKRNIIHRNIDITQGNANIRSRDTCMILTLKSAQYMKKTFNNILLVVFTTNYKRNNYIIRNHKGKKNKPNANYRKIPSQGFTLYISLNSL